MLSTLVTFAIFLLQAHAQIITSYPNDFVDPDYLLSGTFPPSTSTAQATIKEWATSLAAEGPWSVTFSAITPPSGDKHDYLSWAPYSHPNCTNLGNTTEIPQEEVWTKCDYYTRDGIFNPDRLLVNNIGAFNNLADAVFYGAMAHALEGQPSTTHSKNIALFINTWFLDPNTRMNPNLNFAQLKRGPDGQIGSRTGVLDLKCLAKVLTGILVLRKSESPDWTPAFDQQMISWSTEYIQWLETSSQGLDEGNSDNNHGSFYYNQLASLKIITNDLPGAKNVTETYFNKQYMAQIEANGEQPLEAARTRPYHYRAYNLAAMITSARLQQYADPSAKVWNKTTTTGSTIKTALDFAMTISPTPTGEDRLAWELYPPMAAVASMYGDEGGRYAAFLAKADPGYAAEPYFLWNQPLAGGTVVGNTGIPTKNSTRTTADKDNAAASGRTLSSWLWLGAAVFTLLSLL